MIPSVLTGAVVYDEECFPNLFSVHVQLLEAPVAFAYIICPWRDDRHALLAWLGQMRANQHCMIGFNSIGYDYVLLHHLMRNPYATNADLYAINNSIITSTDRFGLTIWPSDRLIPQVDLFKTSHFDNKSKTTSLKALQVNMRSPSVEDSPIAFGTELSWEQINQHILPYGNHDVAETKRFAMACMPALSFRAGLIPDFGIDVLNYSDVKIGAQMLIRQLGEDVCFYRDAEGRRQPRQTQRQSIPLADIIFPYIRFDHPEFQRVLAFMRKQVLVPEDLEDPDAQVQTKGVFRGLTAQVGGINFVFGTGGMHASVERQVFTATDDWLIRDIDVAGMYPAISNANRLAPEHLGEKFVGIYAQLPIERAKYPKGTQQNAAYKLAGNAAWGQSNSKFGPFRDPKYAMTIPINGQLMICMLAEWLAAVPTVSLIQCNTDGITYRIHRNYEPTAATLCRVWEATTGLTLESVNYARMFIHDVNTYVAVGVDGKVKQKGRLWHAAPDDLFDSITAAGAWHKDQSAMVCVRAAVEAMVNGVDVEAWIRAQRDPWDFMCRARCDRASVLKLGERVMPRTLRYYVALVGDPLAKVSPPAGKEGAPKRANGVSEIEYDRVMKEVGWVWDERVCTKNHSLYITRRTNIETGFVVAECNDARRFDWGNVNYTWYIEQAKKLIVAPASEALDGTVNPA